MSRNDSDRTEQDRPPLRRVLARLFLGEDAALRRLRLRAALALGFERLWPLLLPLFAAGALFASASWFGLFALMPRWLHVAVLALFGLAGLFGLVLPLRFRPPTQADVTARIETVNGLAHEPLAVQTGAVATGADDPVAAALWREHRRRMAARLRNLRSGLPHPRIPERDPLALRAVAALLFVVAFAYSIGPGSGRLADAFHIRPAAGSAPARIDAWVTPPHYSGRAPIFLTGGDAGESPAAITVPQGSVVSIRAIGDSALRLTATAPDGDSREVKPAANEDGADADSLTFHYDLQRSETLALSGADLRWSFAVTPDAPPKIRFTKEPSHALNGTLQLSYAIEDDYIPAKAYAEITPVEAEDHDLDESMPLYDAPDMPLSLPRRGATEATTAKDLTMHPWSGGKVSLTLVVVDAAGQTGRSETKVITLPERPFANPLARAVVEQRRILAIDGTDRDRVLDMLSAIMLRPEETIKSAAPYLGLSLIHTQLRLARSDEALRDAADTMWQVATGIEDGQLSAAERRLRQAQEALKNALQNGASQEEIDKLSAELRQAMQAFLREFAARQQKPGPRPPFGPNARMLTEKDLQRMMDQIETLARQGARDQAQQLLSQLQNLMDNLQMGQAQSGGQDEMQRQMNALSDLMRRQQQMMNETYKLDQKMQRRFDGGDALSEAPGAGDTPPDVAEALKKLQGQQKDLQSDLQKLMDGLKGSGVEPGKDFSDAGKAMGDAAEALGQNESGQANDRQGGALEALRRGGRDMMKKMREAMGQPGGQSEGKPGRDPLGRSLGAGDSGDDVKVPGAIDIQRAREILDEIRRRLGDALTPQMEKDYLQRLLQFD